MAEPGWRPAGWLRIGTVLPGLVGIGLFVGAWQLVATQSSSFLPTVGAVWDELSNSPGFYLSNALWTLSEAAVGLSVSFGVAFVLAVAMTHVAVVERTVMPLAVILNVTPVVALAPGLAITIGLGSAPRYIVTGLIVFFPLLINSLVGLRSVDEEALEFLRSVDASRAEVLWRLRIPSSLPFLFAAARVCLPLSLVGAVVAEFTTSGGDQGLGAVIYQALPYNNLAVAYTGVICLTILGLLLTLGVVLLERRVLAWNRAG